MFTLTESPLSQFFFDDIFKLAFWRAVLCEFVGTLILVFVGCGSIVAVDHNAANSDILRTSIAFGFTVNFLIKTFGPMSGCHINPAVSIAFMIIGKVSPIRAVFYSIAQMLGSTVGAALLLTIEPSEDIPNKLGATLLKTGMTPLQGFCAEAIFTFILLIAISACLDERQADYGKMKITNPMTIGFTVTAIHLVGIPFTGSSLNPARSFGPALITLNWHNHWVYLLGPIAGACFATVFYHFVMSPHFYIDIPTLPIVKGISKQGDTITPPVVDDSAVSSLLQAVIAVSGQELSSSSSNNAVAIDVPIESYNNQRWNRRRSTMKLPSSSLTPNNNIVASITESFNEQDADESRLFKKTAKSERRNTIHTD